MNIRPVKPQDITMANDWRRLHGVPELPEDAHPGSGYVAESQNGTPLAMGWLYYSNSRLAYLAWPIVNPGFPKRPTHKALRLVIEKLVALARATEVKYLVSTSAHRGLTRMMLELGMRTYGPHELLTMEVV